MNMEMGWWSQSPACQEVLVEMEVPSLRENKEVGNVVPMVFGQPQPIVALLN